jgi:hypothetical protein
MGHKPRYADRPAFPTDMLGAAYSGITLRQHVALQILVTNEIDSSLPNTIDARIDCAFRFADMFLNASHTNQYYAYFYSGEWKIKHWASHSIRDLKAEGITEIQGPFKAYDRDDAVEILRERHAASTRVTYVKDITTTLD